MDCAVLDTTTNYEIVAWHSGLSLGIDSDSMDKGASVFQRDSSSVSTTWSLEDAGNGHDAIVNGNSGFALNVGGYSMENGANIIQWTSETGENDDWCFSAIGDYYTIVAKHSGQAIDVAGAATTIGANILQWPISGNENQQFSMVASVVTSTDDIQTASTSQFFRSSGKAYDVQINLLTPEVLDGYENVDELCDDLEQTARFYVNSIIEYQRLFDYRRFPLFFTEAEDADSPSAAGATGYKGSGEFNGEMSSVRELGSCTKG